LPSLALFKKKKLVLESSTDSLRSLLLSLQVASAEAVLAQL
jgi:hypothetical protein